MRMGDNVLVLLVDISYTLRKREFSAVLDAKW
jgi:hypothetical protein